MINSFEHKGLQLFWETQNKKGIQPAHAKKLTVLLTYLNNAARIGEMDMPGWGFKPLKNWGVDFYSVQVNGNYRLTWFWKDGNAEKVNYVDYH